MPTAASRSATPAKIVSSVARNRAEPCVAVDDPVERGDRPHRLILVHRPNAARISLVSVSGGTAVRATRLLKISGA